MILKARALVLLAALWAPGAFGAESLFTKLVLDRCKTVSEDQGGVILRCPGLKKYPILYKEGDLRPSVFYGPVNKDYSDSAFESFSAFASVNTTVEWRIADKKPYAAIVRFFISNADPQTGATPDSLKGQVLVVSRVASSDDGRSCVIGMVDALANRNANEIARKLADEQASQFACGSDQALFEGEKGPLSSTFSSSLPGSEQGE